MMQIIDAIKVQILLVPPEHGFPTAHVNIGVGHSRYFLVSKATTTQILHFKGVVLTLTKFGPQPGSKESLCQIGYQKHQLHTPGNCFAKISKTLNVKSKISNLLVSQLLEDFCYQLSGHTCPHPT